MVTTWRPAYVCVRGNAFVRNPQPDKRPRNNVWQPRDDIITSAKQASTEM